MPVTRILETVRTAKLDLLGASAWTVTKILLQIREMKNAHIALKATMAKPVIKVTYYKNGSLLELYKLMILIKIVELGWH